MKLVRFGDFGSEKPGVLNSDGSILDVSAWVEDYNEAFFADGGLSRLAGLLDGEAANAPTAPEGVRLGSPVARPSKIIAIGLNYLDHAKETNATPPGEPLIFTKSSTALCGPNDNVEIPRKSVMTDWEVELCFVIGRRAKYVELDDAVSHIGGYAIMNDVSEREFQKDHCGQWVKGKSHDTFGPMGPFLATPDELGDVNNLAMSLDVNGQRRQTGNTSTMIFKPPFLIHYISQFMTLLPGDIITTGTPPGVGMGMKPPTFLKSGDVIDVRIEGLGQQRQTCVQA
ncbi:MAG: hypothetical protein GC154_01165 [bacterium]|nr:hypothetical protein [bacterium]